MTLNSGKIAIGDSSSNGYITLNTKPPTQVETTTSLGIVRNGSATDESFVSFDIYKRNFNDKVNDYFRTHGENAGLQLQSDKDIIIEASNGLTIDTADVTVRGNITSTGNVFRLGNLSISYDSTTGAVKFVAGEKSATITLN